MSRDHLRLGTRASPLALAQSGQTARALEARHDGLTVELVPISTKGDRFQGDLATLGGKGLFTEELEAGLLAGELDFAVHSLKDLPVRLPAGLHVAAYPERADPRDVLVSEVASSIAELPEGAVVLTGSLRRQAQIRARRPDLVVEGLRGNVDTRLRKWRERRAGGVILAAAGLARLGISGIPSHPLDPEEMLPAPGQGILALEARAGSSADVYCRALAHPPSARAAEAERAVVAAFGGDCTLPLAAWAREASEDHGALRLSALLALPDGSRLARGEAAGDDPQAVAQECVRRLREDGADAVRAALAR
ncbi:MAG: hydroxymethylbilane synthase [Acidobacteriota bacterium]